MDIAFEQAHSIAAHLWAATWQAAILAMLVAAVCLVARKHLDVRWQFILWGLVLVRLASPVFPASSYSLFNYVSDPRAIAEQTQLGESAKRAVQGEPVQSHRRQEVGTAGRMTDALAKEHPTKDTHRELQRHTRQPTDNSRSNVQSSVEQSSDTKNVPSLDATVGSPNSQLIEEATPLGSNESVEEEVLSTSSTAGKIVEWSDAGVGIGAVIVALWLLVALFMTVRKLGAWIKLRRVSLSWSAVSDRETLSLFDECQSICRPLLPVTLLRSDQGDGPAVYGILRPRIVLPTRVLSTTSREELRMILLHELVHVRRFDVLWESLATLLVCLHWFNPISFWARKRVRDLRELACDAAVLEIVGQSERRAYGLLVMSVAQQRQSRLGAESLIGIEGRKGTIYRRVEMIASFKNRTWRQVWMGLPIVLAIGLAGLTSANVASNEESKPVTGNSTEREESREHETGSQPQDEQDDEVNAVQDLQVNCNDSDGKPVEGARVRVFLVNSELEERDLLADETTNEKGAFRLRQVRKLERYEHYAILVSKSGLGSASCNVINNLPESRNVNLVLYPAATFEGRVMSSEGEPLEGARVWFSHPAIGTERVEGYRSDITNADGRFIIEDCTDPRSIAADGSTPISDPACYIEHEDFAREVRVYQAFPSDVDIKLQPGGVIEGKVVDRVTNQPAVAVPVSIQGANKLTWWKRVKTDEEGRYRINSLPAGEYNLWSEKEGRACVALDSIAVEGGKTYRDKDMELTKGGWVEVAVIDAWTNQPLSLSQGSSFRSRFGDLEMQLGIQGSARPKSGSAIQSVTIDENGRFGIRLPAGRHFFYSQMSELHGFIENIEQLNEGIEIREGELVSLELRIARDRQIKKVPDRSFIDYPVPIAKERASAAAVRRLGGWYELDSDKRVSKVNMIGYGSEDGHGYFNPIKESDEILQWLPGLDEIRELSLCEGQISNEGMRHIGTLESLEVLRANSAFGISDESAAHFAGLTNLRRVHLSQSQVGDETLAVLAKLPQIESLSLQRNQFTDAGVKHLANTKTLKSLWIGMSSQRMSDESLKSVSQLHNLEQLSIQQGSFTDEGVAALESLRALRTLNLAGTKLAEEKGITEDSLETLSHLVELETLLILNCRIPESGIRKLLELPKLKRLSLSGVTLDERQFESLKKDFPNVRFGLMNVEGESFHHPPMR